MKANTGSAMKPNRFQTDSRIAFGFTGTIATELSRGGVGHINESARICIRFCRLTIRAFVQQVPGTSNYRMKGMRRRSRRKGVLSVCDE